MIKRRPPKAKATPPSLCFDGLRCDAPNVQTNDSERKPDGSRPANGVGERRRHDLEAPLIKPWRERAKAAGGIGWDRLMLVVVCCVVVFVGCAHVLFTHFVELSTQPMLNFAPSFHCEVAL